ncbi:MAG: hypothetical protein JNL23_00650 [Chitinophagaceae bacterium]|nr:hypothetical protein [Chitinophagaceae bacterium]
MKPKHFYILLLICCLSILSSANQTSKDCKQATTKACCEETVLKESAADAGNLTLQPLNLLLFEL